MKNKNNSSLSIVLLGATGAVGGACLNALRAMPELERLTLLGRRPVPNLSEPAISQHKINIFDSQSYQSFLAGHSTAICTLGVGQPSKMSREDFVKIDKIAVLDFATACKNAGISHFELLSSVGINANSSSFFLRMKGELVEELKALNFKRLSIFQPSMILTPNNRYGLTQGITLAVWPLLKPLLRGGLRKYRGIRVERLGKAMATNTLSTKAGLEMLTWEDFEQLNEN